MDQVEDLSDIPTNKVEKTRVISDSDKENIAEISKALSDTAPEKTGNIEDFASSVGSVARSLGDAGK
jgi:hypothetical protein